MAAFNRYDWSIKYQSPRDVIAAGIKCVFISHQKRDHAEAKRVANFLIECDINVYFDEYDRDLKFYYQSGNPKAVTDCICNGVNNSSHMLVIVSASTLYSTWVPFEVGYGFERTQLATLCLKGIQKGGLPEYVRTGKIIRDIYDLTKWITDFSLESRAVLESHSAWSSYSGSLNPLSDVMDELISDQYS
jgi:hypothetical protein